MDFELVGFESVVLVEEELTANCSYLVERFSEMFVVESSFGVDVYEIENSHQPSLLLYSECLHFTQ